MIEIPRSASYNVNVETTAPAGEGRAPCAVCGRAIAAPWHYAVHEHDGGGRVVQEGEAARLREGADLGWWPLGKDCLARHPALRAYAYEWRMGEPVPAFPAEHDAEAARIASEGTLAPHFPAPTGEGR